MTNANEFLVRTTALSGLTLVAARTGRSFERHTHAVYGIGVLDAGGQTSASGRGSVEARRGDVITVNPGEVHDGIPLRGEMRCWRMVYFDPTLWCLEYRTSEWTRPVLRDEGATRLFNALFSCAAQGGDALAVEERLVALLHDTPSSVLRCGDVERKKPMNRDLLRARELLADDAATPSLAALAREAGLSRYQFLRAFATAFGMPPHAWAQQQRLVRAEAQLRLGTALAEAAAASGFADQSHMTRTFRRFRGYTPGQYAASFR